MHTDQSAEQCSEAMPSFNFAENFHHLLLITHSFLLHALSLTDTLEIVSLAYGRVWSYCHLFRLYEHEIDRIQERFDLHHKYFLAALPRQAIRFHSLTVIQKMHFTCEVICLELDSWQEMQNITCTLYMHWPAGMRQEWILLHMMPD